MMKFWKSIFLKTKLKFKIMAQPYVGEIRMFAGNFAPAGWQFCDGSLLAISENETLFQLIGTTYGGDGQSTFALPDLRGRAPLHLGSTGNTTFTLAETGGVESVILTTQQIPAHTHTMVASSGTGDNASPINNYLATSSQVTMFFSDPPNLNMKATAIQPIGGNQPHENMQPFLAISFIISLYGIFPSPS
jgi:microcystin-dependent protein